MVGLETSLRATGTTWTHESLNPNLKQKFAVTKIAEAVDIT